jgi:cold shock CspA family protein
MTEEEEVTQSCMAALSGLTLPRVSVSSFRKTATDADILLHANVLRNFGQSSVADGAGITLRVQRTQRGVQAVEVLRHRPAGRRALPSAGEDAREWWAKIFWRLPLEPARVKWFDKGKGFGFANVFGRPKMCSSMPRCCASRALPIWRRARRWRCASSRASAGGWRCRSSRGKPPRRGTRHETLLPVCALLALPGTGLGRGEMHRHPAAPALGNRA